ncbi:MAG: peptide ABC transporter substrate-binding protein, partial [Candidatus Omnitrophica bacterium]|nr:peptide ABC transporter substrate-binding protein [Candidatus Omnitrophota bacterium]
EQMETMDNTLERKEIIRKMIDIVNNDCPWIYLFHSEDYYLFHSWYKNIKVTDLINNKMKYLKIDPQQRLAYIKKHNKPVYWPLITLTILLMVSFIPAVISIRRKYQ